MNPDVRNFLQRIVFLPLLSAAGCSERPEETRPERREHAELSNLMVVADSIYSGAEPHSDAAFASLADLGIKMVVSVDGAIPDVEAARKYGLRYVHIPIGYDGIRSEARLALARVVREVDGPVYFHCHHGKHRGPAAAAIAAIASGKTDAAGGKRILECAGTGAGYVGLWRDVAAYEPPAEGAELPGLVEVAKVGDFAAAMAAVDRAYDNLKLCRESGWGTPEDHPDLVPAHEALLVLEGFRESARHFSDGYGDEFETWLGGAEAVARELEASLKAADAEAAGRHFERLKISCKRCHEKHRD